jgi:hypothetical protein
VLLHALTLAIRAIASPAQQILLGAAAASNVGLRSEVLYVDAADRTYAFVSPTLGVGYFAHSDSMWIGRVGLNVKLGFDPAIPTY